MRSSVETGLLLVVGCALLSGCVATRDPVIALPVEPPSSYFPCLFT